MENYTLGGTVSRPCPCPLPCLPPETPQVVVKDGSKIRNLLRFALSRMEVKPGGGGAEEEGGGASGPGRSLVFTATGKGVAKAITCAEMVKRRVKGLHQLTGLQRHTVDELWEPRQPEAGLDRLTVSRGLPALWILLSSAPLDPTLPGYQAPGSHDGLWAPGEDGGGGGGGQRHKRKRGGGRGGGGGGGGRGGRGRGAPGRHPGRHREPANTPS